MDGPGHRPPPRPGTRPGLRPRLAAHGPRRVPLVSPRPPHRTRRIRSVPGGPPRGAGLHRSRGRTTPLGESGFGTLESVRQEETAYRASERFAKDRAYWTGASPTARRSPASPANRRCPPAISAARRRPGSRRDTTPACRRGRLVGDLVRSPARGHRRLHPPGHAAPPRSSSACRRWAASVRCPCACPAWCATSCPCASRVDPRRTAFGPVRPGVSGTPGQPPAPAVPLRTAAAGCEAGRRRSDGCPDRA